MTLDPWLTQKSCMCPICKWDCLPADLRRERNETLQREQTARPTNATNNEPSTENNEHTVEMPITSSANATPEISPTENTTTPSINATITTSTTTINNTNPVTEKDRPELQNLFASNSSSVSRQTGESPHSGSSSPPSEESEMTSEKRPSPQN